MAGQSLLGSHLSTPTLLPPVRCRCPFCGAFNAFRYFWDSAEMLISYLERGAVQQTREMVICIGGKTIGQKLPDERRHAA